MKEKFNLKDLLEAPSNPQEKVYSYNFIIENTSNITSVKREGMLVPSRIYDEAVWI